MVVSDWFFYWATCVDVLTTKNNKTCTMESRFVSIIETEGYLEHPYFYVTYHTYDIQNKQKLSMTSNSGYHQNMKAHLHPQINKLEATPCSHGWLVLPMPLRILKPLFLLRPFWLPFFLPIQQLDCQWMPKNKRPHWQWPNPSIGWLWNRIFSKQKIPKSSLNTVDT